MGLTPEERQTLDALDEPDAAFSGSGPGAEGHEEDRVPFEVAFELRVADFALWDARGACFTAVHLRSATAQLRTVGAGGGIVCVSGAVRGLQVVDSVTEGTQYPSVLYGKHTQANEELMRASLRIVNTGYSGEQQVRVCPQRRWYGAPAPARYEGRGTQAHAPRPASSPAPSTLLPLRALSPPLRPLRPLQLPFPPPGPRPKYRQRTIRVRQRTHSRRHTPGR